MLTLSTVQTAFVTSVGWRQNVDPNGFQLTGLTTSDSGIYMNEVHPLLTLQNLSSICPDFSSYVYPAWASATTYAVGDKVTVSNVTYRCILAHTNQTPPNGTYWEVWNNNKAFTEWLTNRTNGAISQFINDWLGRKFKRQSARSLIERERFYYTTGSNTLTIANPGSKMAGMEISVIRGRGVSAKIREISLHFSDAQSLTLYLYKSGNRTPVESTSLDYTTAKDVQWFTVDWELKGEGSYYLCYSLNELTGTAYDDSGDRNAWTAGWQMPGGRYYSAHPFTAPILDESGVGTDEIENTLVIGGSEVFLTSQIAYDSKSHGLNVGMTVGCDFTDFLVEQKLLFAQAFSLFFAKMLLSELAYNANARVNRNEVGIDRDQVMYELNGVAMNNGFSLTKKYEDALSAIQFDTTSIDPVCMPCAAVRGLEYGTV